MKIKSKVIVYEKDTDNHEIYRIPSLVMASDGGIIAFCEGRKNGLSDSGFINLVCKKSMDKGLTWSSQSIVVTDGLNTFGNCCCVRDKDTNRLHIVCNFNNCDGHERLIKKGLAPREAYYLYSDDDGVTFSKPRNITSQVKKSSWGWLAFGPCHGLQMDNGRIVFPCNHTNLVNGDARIYYSNAIYSDDGCETFKLGEDVGVNSNECSIALTKSGDLYINMRSYFKDNLRRRAYSYDGGQTWEGYEKDSKLIDPVCHGSVINLEGSNIIAFSNAASKSRENLTIRLSDDDGKTWKESLVIEEGKSAYSDLISIDKNTIGCLYEYGVEHEYEYIGFAIIEV